MVRQLFHKSIIIIKCMAMFYLKEDFSSVGNEAKCSEPENYWSFLF
jgi:hypothetical protein